MSIPKGPLAISSLADPPHASVRVPGSKSLTNRALLTAALATGTSRLTGALRAEDTEAMLDAIAVLGAEVDGIDEHGAVTVRGLAGTLMAGPITIDARQSGTTARFCLPVAALSSAPFRVDGAEQLRARPMAEGIRLLRALGLDVHEVGELGRLPIEVHGGPAPGDAVSVRGDVSSQFLSGLLLSGPCLQGGLEIAVDGALVSRPYVDLTLDVMRAFGATVDVEGGAGAATVFRVAAGGYVGTELAIEPDASAASYFFAAAAICGGTVRVEGLGAGSHQGDLGVVSVLEAMGAEVEQGPDWTEVRGTGTLHGVDVDLRDLSDTVPTVAIVAACASTRTELRGIGFIRAKESDRIGAVVAELRRCGVQASETADGMLIDPGQPVGATVHTYDDHRIAMAFAVLGLRVPGIVIDEPGCVAKTFPGFFDVLDGLRVPGH